MGPPPAQQCTNVSISDDTLLEDEFETVPLTLSSDDSDVTFTAGGNSVTISIQDDESELLPCKHILQCCVMCLSYNCLSKHFANRKHMV